ECAALLDLVQFMAELPPGGAPPRIRPDRLTALTGTSTPAAIDVHATAAAIQTYYQQLDRDMALSYRPGYRDALLRERLQAAQLNDFTKQFVISYQSAWLDRLRTEAKRRAVGLLLALHDFHDENGRWPTALDE